MIELLRIQCPVCGTFLEVKNSKNEAVKHITCPKCKKQLSVDFQEKTPVTPKPLEALYYGALRIEMQEGINQIPLPGCDCIEIKVVRLNDGNSKCLVRSKSPQHQLFINGFALNAEDQVALASGDELRTGNTVLTFAVPGNVNVSTPPTVEPINGNVTNVAKDVEEPSQSNFRVIFIALAVVAIIFGGWLFVNKYKVVDTSKLNSPAVISSTVERERQVSPVSPKIEVTGDRPATKKSVESQTVNPPKAQDEPLSDYQLEVKASQGDVEAQFELGNRLVHKAGTSNVLKGLNYLKLAAQNGSQKARSTYKGAVSAIRQRAENGDEVANEILMSIE